MMHEDLDQDQKMIAEALEPIVTIMKQMMDKINAMDEELDSLTKLVQEEILDGIEELYTTKERQSGIGSYAEKYGETFGPYKDFYSELTDGADIFEKLYDEISEMKKEKEDWNDEMEQGEVSKIAELLKSKFDKIKGINGPASVEVEIEASGEKESEESPEDKLKKKIREMSKKASNVRMN